jgi:hypothetical protein
MARNGSGTYTLPAGNPVVTGSTISSTWANNTLGDIGTALTGSIAKDGQTTPTANLPMGTYAHTNVGNASLRTMYGSAAQVQDNTFQYLTSVAGTNTITATAPFGMTAYATGQRFTFIAAGANTGATTLNLNSIGAKAITKNGTTALVASDIASGQAIEVVYDGTQFQLINVSALTGVSSFSAGSTGLTPSTATTGAVTLAGTLAVANGGTNNASLAVTAGGTLYTDGSKVVNVGAGTSGQVLTSAGASAPTWSTLAVSGTLLDIRYFTTAGTSTYTPTAGTTFVVVEVVGGGGGGSGSAASQGTTGGGGGGYAKEKITSSFSGVTITVGAAGTAGGTGSGGNGGTSSFGALVSATGGAGVGATGGTGSGGDLNLTGSKGFVISTSLSMGGNSPIYSTVSVNQTATGVAGNGYGGGGSGSVANFTGVCTGAAGTQGLVIVYEYK